MTFARRKHHRLPVAIRVMVATLVIAGTQVIAPPGHAALASSARQIALPALFPGQSGLVTMRVTEFLGLFPTSAVTVHWMAPPGMTTGDPVCGPGVRTESHLLYDSWCGYESGTRPYNHSLILRAHSDTPKGSLIGKMRLLYRDGSVQVHHYAVIVR